MSEAKTQESKMSRTSSRNRSPSIEWVVRPMRHEDISKCLEIWLKVELAESHQTVASALDTDPGGFYVAERVPGGQVVGMCAGPMTRDDTAFMGFYAVDPQFQGIGIGRELWSKTVGRLDASINIGLYGVPAMSEKYKKTGFKLEDSITMSIYESRPNDRVKLDLLKDLGDLGEQQKQFPHKFTSFKIEPIDEQTDEKLFKKLVAYDASVQLFSRDKLLRNYLRKPRNVPVTLAIVKCNYFGKQQQQQQDAGKTISSSDEPRVAAPANRAAAGGGSGNERKSSCCCAKPGQESIIENETLSTNLKTSCSLSNSVSNVSAEPPLATTRNPNQAEEESPVVDPLIEESLVGYGCVRFDNTSGGMVGPLYADSDELCEVLLRNLLARFELLPGAKYSIMSLSSHENAGKILEKIGLSEMDKCSRMFTKFIPKAAMSKIYYVHSPNFTLF